MRFVLIALALAGCATPPPPPDVRVQGCWIDRDGEAPATLRFLPDPASPGALAGEHLRYGAEGPESLGRYKLERRPLHWSLCRTDGAAAVCWPVAEGVAGPLGEGLIFIDVEGDRLRIALHEPGDTHILFYGRRDGCD